MVILFAFFNYLNFCYNNYLVMNFLLIKWCIKSIISIIGTGENAKPRELSYQVNTFFYV